MNFLHSSGSIRVMVLPDAAPEAEEVYIIQLVSASGSAVIDPSADIARLTVRETIHLNDIVILQCIDFSTWKSIWYCGICGGSSSASEFC